MHVCLSQCQGLSRVRPVFRSLLNPRRLRRSNSEACFRLGSLHCTFATIGSGVGDLALINVDYISPSLWLGVVLGITGMILYSLKFRDARGTTEGDIVAASLFVMCGGILTLQGWRLDPILMLSEFVLGGVGIVYMVQTVNLRKQLEILEDEEQEVNRRRRWSLPRQRSYGSYEEYGRLPEGSYGDFSRTFDQRIEDEGYDSFDRRTTVDSSWPRTAGRGTTKEAPEVNREDSWQDDYDVDIPYGVDTSSPTGRVPPEVWERKRS